MNVKNKLVIWLLITSIFLSGVFAEDFVCCYTGSSITMSTSCSDENTIGEILQPEQYLNPNFSCSFRQLECKTSSGQCTSSIAGNNIFDHIKITSKYASICTQFFLKNSNCIGNENIVLVNFSSNINGSEISSTGSLISDNITSEMHISQTNLSNLQIENFQKVCSDAGGQFGLFASKTSCEAINGCLFNPIYGGFLTNSFAQTNFENSYDFFEKNVCISKALVQKCSDYKTKENCEENSALLYSKSLQGVDVANIENGCFWIDSNNYFESEKTFSKQNGICISNLTYDSNYYDRKIYADRENMILNPSFENENNFWLGISNSKLQSSNSQFSCYHQNTCYDLGNSNISQNVYGFTNQIKLSSFLYIQRRNFDDENIEAKVTFYNFNGNTIGYKILTHKSLNNFNFSFGGFERLEFNSFQIPNGTNYINYELKGIGENIVIDAVSINIETSSVATEHINDFKPVEIIKPSASYCELCYNSLDLNSCTKKKSDLLGDCSYMTFDVSKKYESNLTSYSGKDENSFLKTVSESWKSQSLANSLLFCEMYTREDECINSENFVNSKYSSIHIGVKDTSSNLCKWDSIIGCYKDSNGDNKRDTINGIRKSLVNEVEFNSLEASGQYKFISDLSSPSDFALGCDVIPPNGYVFFKAKNQLGEEKYIYSQDFSEEIFGNLKLVYDTYDYPIQFTPACKNFDFKNFLIFDYKVGSSLTIRQSGEVGGINTRLFGEEEVKNFLKNSTDSLLSDGINYLNLRIVDRSGNVGFDKEYVFNLDANGPVFSSYFNDEELSPHGEILSTVLGKGNSFSFSISDYSKVAWCNYSLTPTPSINNNYYSSKGTFDLSNISGENKGNNEEFIYNFIIPINNTPVTVTFFKLDVTCADIFDQKNTNSYWFKVDFDTNLLLTSSQYINYSQKSGHVNNTFNLSFISSDRYLSSCTLVYNNGVSRDNFGKVNLPFGNSNYGINSSSTPFIYPGRLDNFYVNITVPVSLQNIGLNTIFFSCTDVIGNIHTENVSYYLDNINPEFITYNLINTNVSNRKSVAVVDGKYYVNNLTNVKANLTFDGTGSCISNFSSLRAYNASQILYSTDGNVINLPFILKTVSEVNIQTLSSEQNIKRTCNSTNYISNFILTNFNTPLIYTGIKDINNYDLYHLKYGFDFVDFAGNMNSYDSLEFYYDSKTPVFNFTENAEITYVNNKLYTKKTNPKISIDFMTPNYRNYTCDIKVKEISISNNRNYNKVLNSNGSVLSFNLNDVSSGINISKYSKLELTFVCSDNYGPLLNKPSFELIYDIKDPILIDLSFDKKNIYLPKYDGLYDDINASLIFSLANTNETQYLCQYVFSSTDYDCKMDVFEVSSSNLYLNVPLVLVENNQDLDSNSICARKGDFTSIMTDTNNRYETSIFVKGRCFDMVNQATVEKNTKININYVKTDMLGFEFTYSQNKAYPIVKVSNQYDNIVISYDNLGVQEIAVLTYNNTIDGVFIYTHNEGISLDNFEEGVVPLYAVGFLGGVVSDSIFENLIIDRTIPSLEFLIPDNTLGSVYSSEFILSFDAFDIGGLKKIELYENSQNLIFNYDVQENNFVYNSAVISGDFENWNSCSYQSCFGDFMYINGTIQTNHSFTLKVYDIYGNFNLSMINVRVMDGVSVILLDSEKSSKVSPNKQEWLTRVDSPVISFKTSRPVEFCRVFPMIDNEWNLITGDYLINQTSSLFMSTSENYSIDLSQFLLFNLSKKSDLSSSVRIVCNYNGSTYSYIRKIKLINYLPDYVLSSSEGFVLNEKPYTSNIMIKSVGPYRYLEYCNYTLNGVTSTFNQRGKTKFIQTLDFSSLSSGVNNMVLVCSDIVGNVGPTKSYSFIVGKEINLGISDLMLSKNGQNYLVKSILSDEMIYVSDNGPYTIKFNTNKKNGVSCSYSISPSDTQVSRIIFFFKNLFNVGYEDVQSLSSVYSYEKSGIILGSEFSDLRVRCTLGSEEIIKNYIVIRDSSQINVTIDLN